MKSDKQCNNKKKTNANCWLAARLNVSKLVYTCTHSRTRLWPNSAASQGPCQQSKQTVFLFQCNWNAIDHFRKKKKT